MLLACDSGVSSSARNTTLLARRRGSPARCHCFQTGRRPVLRDAGVDPAHRLVVMGDGVLEHLLDRILDRLVRMDPRLGGCVEGE